ncbi:MAG: GntR family transcriptional regulator, partial [Leptotrichiaceae bacterium]
LRELLRTHYKPMIVFSEKEEYKFDKVLLLDDGGYKSNRSLFEFFNVFGEQKVDVLRVNIEDEDLLRERFKENYNLINKSGDPLKVIVEEVKKYDFIIMGDLKYAVMLEKITGKLGIKLLEAIKKPIFIG